MTKQQISNLFSWLAPSEQPKENGPHTMLMQIDELSTASEVSLELQDQGVSFTCELADDNFYEVEVQAE
jgi:hypothetical protein